LVVDVSPWGDILRPRLADNVDNDAVEGVIKLDHDEGGSIPLLVQVGVEVAGEPCGRPVRHVAYVLVVQLVLKTFKTNKVETAVIN